MGAMSAPDAWTPEELERHGTWLRSLVRALVGEDGADDVTQDALVAALRARPSQERSLRPWLARVASNLAFQRRRAAGRRAEHEAHATPPPDAPDPADIVERLDAARALIDVFETLPEPFRHALYMRHWEGLAPGEIAERIGVPAGTVRWRLSRGLAELRRRLDARHGGERGAWCALLLPLGGSEEAIAAASASTVSGALIMSQAAKVAGALVAIALFTIGYEAWRRSAAGRATEVAPQAVVGLVAPADPPATAFDAADGVVAPRERGVERRALPAPSAAVSAPVEERDRWCTVSARIVDEDGAPIVGARLADQEHAGQSALSDSEGRVELRVAVVEPRLRVEADASRHARLVLAAEACGTRWLECEATGGGSVPLGALVLAPEGRVTGRVVDASGEGVAEALVGCTFESWGAPDPRGHFARAQRLDMIVGRADQRGFFELGGLPAGSAALIAVAGELVSSPAGGVVILPRETVPDLMVRVAAVTQRTEALFSGRVLDETGRPIPEVALTIFEGEHVLRSFSSQSDGTYSFSVPLERAIAIDAYHADHAPVILEAIAQGRRTLDIVLPARRPIDLAVVDDASGDPLPSFGYCFLREEREIEESHAGWTQDCPEGRMALPLRAEPVWVAVWAPGHAREVVGPLAYSDAPELVTVRLKRISAFEGVVLARGEPLAGAVVRLFEAAGSDALWTRGDFPMLYFRRDFEAVDADVTDEDGSFVLTPWIRGAYFARAELEGYAPADIGPLEFDPEVTARAPLELVLRRGGSLAGRVTVAGGGDPAGLVVAVSRADGAPSAQRVDASGAFRFDGLTPGPWLVVARDSMPPNGSSCSDRDPALGDPFDWTCVVEEGRTTEHDLVFGACRVTGRMKLDGEPANGWRVRFEQPFVRWPPDFALDSRGRFRLVLPEPDAYELTFVSPWSRNRDRLERVLASIVAASGETEFELSLETGILEVEGIARGRALAWVWQGRSTEWASGHLWPDKGAAQLRVPAGKVWLVDWRDGTRPDARALPSVAQAYVPPGGEARISLR